ncbi:MAG TPA: tetratricopeptide repeat protein [Allocoleopsis sp.]
MGVPQLYGKRYSRAITYAEETHYTQVKALALTGLAELYRKQENFETAFSHHSESIELLEKIGTKCDLAEGYYQQGLTYQKMGNAQNSQENFDKAIQLFSEIEASKQVEKVRQAMESGK